MKSKTVLAAIAMFCLLALTKPSLAQESPKRFSLILSGGYGTITGGDIPKVIDGTNATIHDLAAVTDFAVVDTLETAKWGPELEAEFLFRPNRNFGLSLGAGFLRKTEDTRAAAELEEVARLSLDWTAIYRVIPLRLSGYFFFEAGSKMTAYAKAGIGYYFGKMTYTTRSEETLLGIIIWDQNDGEATASGLGFHGGLGLEYAFSSTFALFIEAAGRYVDLKEWSAENDYSTARGSERQTGKFWYAEEWVEGTGKYYPSLQLLEEKPTDPDFRNVREAAIGFSGFALKGGVKICF